jgi:hypothetical protein
MPCAGITRRLMNAELKLSQAIRLGSLLIEEPRLGIITHCAIGMALAAHSVKLDMSRDVCEQVCNFWEDHYPWIRTARTHCPQCDWYLDGASLIFHPFDCHVMADKTMTIEQLCDFIASIEPSESEPVISTEKELVAK